MKNLTYSQLIELALKDRPFQIETSEGVKLWAFMFNTKVGLLGKYDVSELNPDKNYNLIDPRYQKPEVLKEGQKVKIIRNNEITNTGTIYWGYDNGQKGLYYDVEIDNEQRIISTIPHYCVMPVEEEEEENDDLRGIPGLEGMIEEFEGLCIKAQEIVDKYKK